MSSANRFIHIAANLYRLLIFIYPASFRREFGREMVVIFRDISCAERDKKGAMALIGLWIALFFDLIATAVIERIREVYAMSTSNFGRIAGLGGILAGILWPGIIVFELVLNKDGTEGLIWAIPPALMLLVTIALYLQFEHNVFGVLGLAVFALGTVLLVLAMISFELGADGAFSYNFFGYSIQGLGLLISGIAFRSRGYFKPWSTMLIPLGAFLLAWWPVSILLMGMIFSLLGKTPLLVDQYSGIIWSANWVVAGAAWIILGAIVLVGDQQSAEQPLKTA